MNAMRIGTLTIGLLAFIAPSFADEMVPLPRPRPMAEANAEATPKPMAAPDNEASIQDEAPRLYQAACPAALAGRVVAELLPPIEEDGCGLTSPYETYSINLASRRIELTAPATLNCAMMSELADWLGEVDAFAKARTGHGVEAVLSGTSYQCRSRNNVAGADVSEHGFGNALDVTGFRLDDGTIVQVASDWHDKTAAGALIHHARDAACGRFTTVLSPEANAAHADHLHIDLGCHGRTCNAVLCQ